MSKRIIRIKPEQIHEDLSSKAGLYLNAVLGNGQTYFGTLSAVDHDFIIMKDTRDHTHKIPLHSIYEILYDLAGN